MNLHTRLKALERTFSLHGPCRRCAGVGRFNVRWNDDEREPEVCPLCGESLIIRVIERREPLPGPPEMAA